MPSVAVFYKSCGFEYSDRIENFFTDNHDHQMIEDRIQLKDMVYLKRNISENIIIKTYYGRMSACGVFCSGYHTYTRENGLIISKIRRLLGISRQKYDRQQRNNTRSRQEAIEVVDMA